MSLRKTFRAAILVLVLLLTSGLGDQGTALSRRTTSLPAGRTHAINGYGYYRITAYFPTGNRTATGTVARWGELAVDRNVIPLGSWVHIEGIGTFRAEDTGGLVWGRHLDVLVYTWAQAYWVQGRGYRKAYWW